jgi:uncharacterized RDD family membrane protein YckC
MSGQAGPQAPLSGFDILLKDSGAQGYWIRRLLALLIDAVLVGVLLALLGVAIAVPYLVLTGPTAVGAIFAGLFGFVYGVAIFLYFMLVEGSAGTTLGKRVMGLKVVGPTGRGPNLAEAAVRNVSKIYWVLLFLDTVIGLAVSKGYRQKLSDRFANTEVMDLRRAS